MGEVNVNKVSNEGQAPRGAKVARRTVVKGVAWSIPVIAVSAALPAAAASTGVSITLTQTAPPVSLCGTYSDVVFNVKQNGVAAPNQLVTVTLAGGTTFADGTTTKVLQSDAAGNVTVSGLVAKSPSGTVTAQVGTASAQTSLSAIADTLYTSYNGGDWVAAPSVPGDIVDSWVNNDQYLVRTADGKVYYNSRVQPVTTAWTEIINPAGVSMVEVESYPGGHTHMALGSDGRAYSVTTGTVGATVSWTPYTTASNIQQISYGQNAWMALGADGTTYWWNDAASANPALNTIPNPAGVVMTRIEAHVDSGWWIGIGSDGKAYRSTTTTGWVPLLGAGNADIVDVTTGSNVIMLKNSSGQTFVTPNATTALTEVTAPAPLSTIQAWYAGNWAVALGEDGNPYWYVIGSSTSWTRFPGTPDGQVVQFSMGRAQWAALLADGSVYNFNGGGTAVQDGTAVLTQINPNPPAIIELATDERSGGFLLGAGVPTTAC